MARRRRGDVKFNLGSKFRGRRNNLRPCPAPVGECSNFKVDPDGEADGDYYRRSDSLPATFYIYEFRYGFLAPAIEIAPRFSPFATPPASVLGFQLSTVSHRGESNCHTWCRPNQVFLAVVPCGQRQREFIGDNRNKKVGRCFHAGVRRSLRKIPNSLTESPRFGPIFGSHRSATNR